MLTKQEIKKLLSVKGNIRGEAILIDIRYIHYKKGEKGIKMIEKRMGELGYPIKFKDLKPMKWYPVGLDALKILIIKEVFNWSNKDIFKMANFASKVSFLTKMMVKYFLSAERSFKESPRYWKQNFDIGELEASEFNREKKYMIFRVKGYKVHPITCVIFAGYFLRIAQFVLKSDKVSIKESKCMYNNSPYHEFIIKWE